MNSSALLTTESAIESAPQTPLRENVKNALRNYFSQLGDHAPTNLYDLVLEEIEIPLLEMVMEHVKHNQCKAAILLGLSRGTLRKKLKIYNLEKAKHAKTAA